MFHFAQHDSGAGSVVGECRRCGSTEKQPQILRCTQDDDELLQKRLRNDGVIDQACAPTHAATANRVPGAAVSTGSSVSQSTSSM